MLENIKNFFNELKESLLVIFSILTAVFVALFFIEKKKDTLDKAKVDNAETKGKVEQIDSEISDLEKQTKEKENEPVSKDDLLNFLNGNKPK